MNTTVEGLVLRAVNYKESDKILTVLTKEHGKITVKAAGSRRKTSPLASCSQPFCYSEMTLFEKGGKYTIDEAYVISQFYGLCSDIEKMALASYFSQILTSEPEETPGGEASLRLVLNSFYALEKGLAPQGIIKSAFELRYMAMNGYAPDISACSMCGETSGGGFINLESGLRRCEKCARPAYSNDYYLDGEALQAAKYILTCDLKRLFSFRLPQESLKRLADFTEQYLLYKTEQGYKTLDFYKSLFRQEVQE